MVLIPKSHSEWLEARSKGLGASEAASFLGMSKWKTNVELFEEKTGRRKPEDIGHKPYVQYGHDAEPHIRALFALDHPELRVTYESPYKMIFSDELPFLFATPDGELEEIATGRHGGLEIKTTEIMNPRQWADWKDRIPDQYYCQVCHQMLATGWDFVWLRAQIKWTTREGDRRIDTRDYLIERVDALDDIAALRDGAIKFWHYVETDTCPALILPEI